MRLARISRHKVDVERALAVLPRQVVENPLSHFGSGLPRERDREDVARLDAGHEQPDVTIDKDARLARYRPTLRARRCASDRPPARAPPHRAARGASGASKFKRGWSVTHRCSSTSLDDGRRSRTDMGPHSDFFTGRGGKCPAAILSSVVSRRSSALGDQRRRSCGPSLSSGTTVRLPSNDR